MERGGEIGIGVGRMVIGIGIGERGIGVGIVVGGIEEREYWGSVGVGKLVI